MRNKNTCRVHIITFLVTSLVIIGVIGYSLWVNFTAKQSDKTTSSTLASKVTPTPMASSSPTPKSIEKDVLKIPEMGLQIANIPEDIADLTYAIDPNGQTKGYKSATFSTDSLTKLDESCSAKGTSIGALMRGEGKYEYNPYAPLLKQFDTFWIAYTHPQSICSNNDKIKDIYTTQTTAAQSLLTNINNIQPLTSDN